MGCGLDPRNDREEFLANQQVVTGTMLERVQPAHIEQITTEIESVTTNRPKMSGNLGSGCISIGAGLPPCLGSSRFVGTSTDLLERNSVDPDHPAKIVAELCKTRLVAGG